MSASAKRNDRWTAFDRRMMARAIALARRGEGRVEPNPMVGCVIARDGRVLGEGYHRRFGGPHAEIEALRSCTASARRATVYVTLEPCSHQGKTPPCCAALIAAGVSRVVSATGDPNPLVRGKGVRVLRAGGVSVAPGLLEAEAKAVLAPYLTRIVLGRPFVIAKWAQSLDGKLATGTGDSQWISCETSRRRVHLLRSRVDAILVGAGTALSDDPLLTARDVAIRRRALRVVLDGRLRLPERSRLVGTAGEHQTIVFTSRERGSSRQADRLRRRGVEVRACRPGKAPKGSSARHRVTGDRAYRRNGLSVGLSLKDVLRNLAKRSVTNLLVEGGGTVLSSFLAAGLVDEALVYTAPILIGGEGAPGPLDFAGVARIEGAISARTVSTGRSGIDMVHRLRFTS